MKFIFKAGCYIPSLHIPMKKCISGSVCSFVTTVKKREVYYRCTDYLQVVILIICFLLIACRMLQASVLQTTGYAVSSTISCIISRNHYHLLGRVLELKGHGWCIGQHRPLTALGSKVQSWAQVNVCVAFHLFSGFPCGLRRLSVLSCCCRWINK